MLNSIRKLKMVAKSSKLCFYNMAWTCRLTLGSSKIEKVKFQCLSDFGRRDTTYGSVTIGEPVIARVI